MKSNIKAVSVLGLILFALSLSSCTPPSWVTEAESIAKTALPIVQGLGSILGAGAGVTQVVNDLNLIITLFDKYQASPSAGALADIQNGLNTVNADLATILPAAHIKNSATQNKVAAIVQLVAGEFTNIAALVAASSASPRSEVRGPKESVPPSSPATLDCKKFKRQYNAIIAGDTQFPRL